MNDTEGIFIPSEMELDVNNKMGYIEHISYRLKLPDCLPCKRGNGVLDNEEFRVMGKAILDFVVNENTKYHSSLVVVLNDLRVNSPHHDLSFVKKKMWEDFTKTQIGLVISAALQFPYIGDPHIGTTNGVISVLFFSSILDNLPDPDTSRSLYSQNGPTLGEDEILEREPELMNAVTLFEMLNDPSDNGIVIPEYQRHDLQWSNDQRRNMIDSMIKQIPIPSIVLAKHTEHEDGSEGPWFLIDGNQRLATLRRFMDTDDELNFDLQDGIKYANMPHWAKGRFENYQFNVEKVKAKTIKQLSDLFHRYNTSGKSMTPVQIRVAVHHEQSALHHLLIAMAGGPTLANRPSARNRLNISEYIVGKRERAVALRKLIEGLGAVTDDEAKQLRRTTEKTYDLWCRIVAYALYPKLNRDEREVDTDYPTAKSAINSVFRKYRNGTTANIQALKLDYIVREVSSLYGDFAFLTMRKVDEITHNDGTVEKIFERGKSVHGWATQIQCCAIWDFSDDELSILKNNPDRFQTLWRAFAEHEIAEARQNSASIWEKQNKWAGMVAELLEDLQASESAISPRQVNMLEAVEIYLSAPSQVQPLLLSTWETAFSELERKWMMNEIEQRESSVVGR